MTGSSENIEGAARQKYYKCPYQTVVLVSHRKSTMNVADAVYEMENGRIS
ncbi:MAG: hypothetical protein MR729_10695 [Dorea sp.]|nr:hypothetical protein [Dorea sp.]